MTAVDEYVNLRNVVADCFEMQPDPADPSGDPIKVSLSGQVTFSISTAGKRLSAPGATVPAWWSVPDRPVTVSDDGQLAVTLVPNDDDDLRPQGFTWHVEFPDSWGWPGFDFNLPSGDDDFNLVAAEPIYASGGQLSVIGPAGPPGSDHLYWSEKPGGYGLLTSDGDLTWPTTTVHTESVTGAHTVDLTEGLIQELTLTGDLTLTLPTPDLTGAGTTLTLFVIPGGHSLTWPSVKWPSGIAPVLPTDSTSMVTFVWTPTQGWCGFLSGAGIAAPA